MREISYDTVHEDLLAALPELTAPYDRLVTDWDNFGGKPPGQYIVFSDTYARLLQVVLTLPGNTPGREALLRRAIEFGESMLNSVEGEVRSLGIDAVAETLDNHPAGREVVSRIGGPSLRAWFAEYSTEDWVRPAADELIDLWGVRAAIAPLLPATPPTDIPGISYPACSPDLATLKEAQTGSDGVVMLAAYGTTHLYAVVRASQVAASDATLELTAKQLATTLGGDNPPDKARARFGRIPPGERVWNMRRGDQPHARLDDAPWIADTFHPLRAQLLAVLSGRAGRLPDP